MKDLLTAVHSLSWHFWKSCRRTFIVKIKHYKGLAAGSFSRTQFPHEGSSNFQNFFLTAGRLLLLSIFSWLFEWKTSLSKRKCFKVIEERLNFRQTSAVYLSIWSKKDFQFSSKILSVLKEILFKTDLFRIVECTV